MLGNFDFLREKNRFSRVFFCTASIRSRSLDQPLVPGVCLSALSCNLTNMLQEVVRTVLTAQECAVHARLLSRNGLMMEVLARSFCTADVAGMGICLTVRHNAKLCVKEGEEAKVEPGETKEF